jgi:hypothetical protein
MVKPLCEDSSEKGYAVCGDARVFAWRVGGVDSRLVAAAVATWHLDSDVESNVSEQNFTDLHFCRASMWQVFFLHFRTNPSCAFHSPPLLFSSHRSTQAQHEVQSHTTLLISATFLYPKIKNLPTSSPNFRHLTAGHRQTERIERSESNFRRQDSHDPHKPPCTLNGNTL